MPTYRRDQDGRNKDIIYGRYKCWKCGEVGHTPRHCKRITSKEDLYEIDRINPGIKFKLYKHTKVEVTTPLSMCKRCKNKTEEEIKLEKKGDKNPCDCTIPVPETVSIDEFKDLNLDNQLLENITDESCCRFEVPTPIQRYALPIIQKGYDVMGCAQTGTGKTAAYIIPMVKFIKDKGYRMKPVKRGVPQRPEVLILAPTRELAQQIDRATRQLTNDLEPRCGVVVVHGGKTKKMDRKCDEIRKGCNILIGTTGTVKKLINDYTITLDKIKFFVLDEADKMLDMGFGPDIDLILDSKLTYIPSKKERQSLLFSATFRSDLQEIAMKSLRRDYRLIQAGAIGSAQPLVTQNFELVETYDQKLARLKIILLDLLVTAESKFHEYWKPKPGRSKVGLTSAGHEVVTHVGQNREGPHLKDFLLHVLGNGSDKKILVFVETRKKAREVAYQVSDYLRGQFSGRFKKKFKEFFREGDDDALIENFGAIFMHGALTQFERERNLGDFKDRVYPIMVSTNVTARGIDIEGVTHVINFDLPQNLSKIPAVQDHDQKISGKKPDRSQFEEYIHRIGRTGRAGNTGEAISFFQGDKDMKFAIPLIDMLAEAQQDVPDWLWNIASKLPGGRQRAEGPRNGTRAGATSSGWNDGIGVEELWGNEP